MNLTFQVPIQYYSLQHWTLLAAKDGETLYISKTSPGSDCGSDYKLLITKFSFKSQKVGETTRAFRHDLDQISYDYTMEVTNRFKGLDLVDRVPKEIWREVYNIV